MRRKIALVILAIVAAFGVAAAAAVALWNADGDKPQSTKTQTF